MSCAIGVLPSGAGADLTIKVRPARHGEQHRDVSSKALDTNPANDTATIGSSVVASPTVQRSSAWSEAEGTPPKGDKKALRAAHCAPAEVKRRNSRKVGKGRVIGGAKKAGAVLPAGPR